MPGHPSPELATASARVAALARHKPGSPDHLNAQRKLREQRLAEYITKTVDAAPPLTDHQRAKLSELLRPVRVGGGSAGD